MRRALSLLVFSSLLAACGDREAVVVVADVRQSKQLDGKVYAEVLVTAAEQSGGEVGRFCVSVHWFPGDGAVVIPAPAYPGSYEKLQICDSGLRDGDQKVYVFVSTRNDIPSGTNMRVQTILGHEIATKDVSVPDPEPPP